MVIKINYTSSDVYVSTSVSPVYVVVNYSGVSTGGGVWGQITGTLSNQTDLQTALDDKVPYTGATANVDLGGFSIKPSMVQITGINSGGTGGVLNIKKGNTRVIGGDDVANNISLWAETGAFGFNDWTAGNTRDAKFSLLSITNNATRTYTLPNLDGTLALLSDIPSLTGFVPYTGATTNVNLGTHRILAQNATIASNGSGDTFTLNHTSGSGIGLNITKGGSGEGLYINKTSGSGNAATIIGTLNATTLVKSGGTSSQFLKADGSVDSTTYVAGSGVSGQVAYWNGTNSQTGSNNLFWDTVTQGGVLVVKGAQGGFKIGNYSTVSGVGAIWNNSVTPTNTNFVLASSANDVSIQGPSSISLQIGTSATTYARIFSTGNFALQNGGAFTDSGQRLQVQGTTLLNGATTISGSTTASSAIARGVNVTSTLVASANNDVLVGLDVNPTFTNGAFTGVANIALRVNGFLQASNFKTTVSSNPNTSTTVIIGTNVGSSITSENNICIGGINNGIGRTTAQSLTTGENNTIVGQGSASYITTGNKNSVLGSRALGGNSTTMSSNIALGDEALRNNTGSNNVSVGATSSLNVTSGSGNVFLGDNAARFQANGSTNLALTGNNNIYIGQQVRGFNNTDTNAIVIGSVGIGLGSNTTVIGNSSTTDTAIYGRMLVNYSAPVIGTHALDVNGTARVSGNTEISAGNLSIFTTNTPRRLNIEQALGGVAAAIGLYAGGGTLNSVIGIDNEATKSLQFATTGNLIFYSGSTIGNIVTTPTNERMRLTSGGNLLVGTTTDNGSRFQVSGSSSFSSSVTITGNIIGDGTTNTFYQISQGNFNHRFFTRTNVGAALERFTIEGGAVAGKAYFQNTDVGIGTTSPSASAILDVTSTTKGFLPPRMTNAQRTAISSPAVGLIVYCTDMVEGLYVYKSTGWTFVI
jgi:hypothetical protein